MELIDIVNYISLKYLIVVVLIIEAIKIYGPSGIRNMMKTSHSKWIIFSISMIVAVAMFFYDVHVVEVKPPDASVSKIFISFLFTITFYSLFAKPTIQAIRDKFNGKPVIHNDEPTNV